MLLKACVLESKSNAFSFFFFLSMKYFIEWSINFRNCKQLLIPQVQNFKAKGYFTFSGVNFASSNTLSKRPKSAQLALRKTIKTALTIKKIWDFVIEIPRLLSYNSVGISSEYNLAQNVTWANRVCTFVGNVKSKTSFHLRLSSHKIRKEICIV